MVCCPFVQRSGVLTLAACGVTTVALLAPSVLRGREQSRDQQCTSRLRLIGQAALHHAQANNQALPSNRREPFTSWNTLILPFMDQQTVFDQYDLSRDWWSQSNQTLANTRVPTLLCPTAPHGNRTLHLLDPDGSPFQATATDYVASAGVYQFDNKPEHLYRGAMASPGRFYGGSKVTAGHAVRLAEVTDGTSNTMLVVEMADKPNRWRAGSLHDDRTSDTTARPIVEGFSFGQWIAPNWNHLRAYTPDGKESFGNCAVNCSNAGSIYSFHPGYANVLMVDGSVRRVRAGLDEVLLVALVSIADGEFLSEADYLAQ